MNKIQIAHLIRWPIHGLFHTNKFGITRLMAPGFCLIYVLQTQTKVCKSKQNQIESKTEFHRLSV